MPVVDEKTLPKFKFLEHCKPGELVRAAFRETIEWAIIAQGTGGKKVPVVVLTGDGAPYWMSTYDERVHGVRLLACLSYGLDFRLIPDFGGTIQGSQPGDFVISDKDYGIFVDWIDPARKAHFSLKDFTIGDPLQLNVASITGWSIWKDGMTEKGEPLKLLEFPPTPD